MVWSIISAPKLRLVQFTSSHLVLKCWWPLPYIWVYVCSTEKYQKTTEQTWPLKITLSRITGCSKVNPIALLCRYGTLNYAQRGERYWNSEISSSFNARWIKINQVQHCWLQLGNSNVFAPPVSSHRVLRQMMLFSFLQGINHRGRSWTPFSFFLK